MPSFRTGTVSSIISERAGLQRVDVDHDSESRRAYVLTQLIGDVAVGDRVVVNTTAVELGLGTGGWDVVHWNLSRESWSEPGPGHIMKLRYTSLQADTGAAEERPNDVSGGGLAGTRVVACDLHSQVPCVAAVVRRIRPKARIVYVMTDGGALPIALSDLVHEMRESGLLTATVTAGNSFGGDLEAVSVHSGLDVAANEAGADVIIAGIGPGAVGTGTRFGSSSVEVTRILDATSSLSGSPIVAVRWSDTDERSRHRGVSHHVTTALELARPGVFVPVPAGEPWRFEATSWTVPPGPPEHRHVEVDVPDVPALLADAGLRVTSMGRGPEDDPGFYRWAGAAGVLAARPWTAEH